MIPGSGRLPGEGIGYPLQYSWASLVAQMVHLILAKRPRSDGSDGKESTFSVGDLDLIPELGRSTGGEHGNPLKYSCLENPHGQRSLEGYSPWGRKESDTTE